MAKILITGGAGFIGSHLAEKLVDKNQIIAYDNLHRNALKDTRLLKHPNFELVEGDILDSKRISEIVDDCNVVIHLAAIAGIESVAVKPLRTLETNLLGTVRLLDAINGKAQKIERFVNYSTSEVYGPFIYQAKENGMTTQGEVSQPRWSYATSKIAAEHFTYSYYVQYKLPITIIRPFNIYGPRQVGEGAIHKFIEAAIKNKNLTIYGAGDAIRAWCYIDDIVDATIKVLQSPKAIGQVYNIGNPQATITVYELSQKIIRLAKSKSRIVFKERNYPDVNVRVPSIDKAKQHLGFKPKTALDEGLQKTISWYRRKLRKK